MQEFADAERSQGKRIAVVPTMGFLHEGHLSLIRLARRHAERVVTTIFVNPTQFGPHEDFDRYPRDLERDIKLAEEAGSDVVFQPAREDMYPPGYQTYLIVEGLSDRLEGRIRPGHFRGVATVVLKLFDITKPHVAVFGQKDAQQACLIRAMVRDLNLDIDIVIGPVVREDDGLAMSSRNVFLSPEDRGRARALYRALLHAEKRIRAGERVAAVVCAEMEAMIRNEGPTGIDYVALIDPATFQEVDAVASLPVLAAVAARFGATRLIDNVVIDKR